MVTKKIVGQHKPIFEGYKWDNFNPSHSNAASKSAFHISMATPCVFSDDSIFPVIGVS